MLQIQCHTKRILVWQWQRSLETSFWGTRLLVCVSGIHIIQFSGHTWHCVTQRKRTAFLINFITLCISRKSTFSEGHAPRGSPNPECAFYRIFTVCHSLIIPVFSACLLDVTSNRTSNSQSVSQSVSQPASQSVKMFLCVSGLAGWPVSWSVGWPARYTLSKLTLPY